MFYGLGTACREVFGTVKGVEFGLLSKKSFDTYGPTFNRFQTGRAKTAARPEHPLRLTPQYFNVLIWSREINHKK